MDIFIPALVAFIAASVPATFAIVSNRKKNAADAGVTVGQMYRQILDELRTEMTRRDAECESRLQEVRNELLGDIIELQAELRSLRSMVINLGGDPLRWREGKP